MPKDIRSFFKVIPKKGNETQKKRPAESSDEDIVASTPEVKKEKPTKRRKVQVIDSDSDDEFRAKKKVEVKETTRTQAKKISAEDAFGSTPIKQTKVEKKRVINKDTENDKNKSKKLRTEVNIHDDKNFEETLIELDKEKENNTSESIKGKKGNGKKPETELGIHDDPDFEKTLLELDEDIFIENVSTLDKTIEEAIEKKSKEPKVHEEDDFNKDLERHEKKRHSALLYQKYLNRSGPVHHGTKQYPKGKPHCLSGLCFLRTGVLDSLEKDEFEELIKEHGGRMVHAVSKKVNFVVAGEDAGPAKLEKAENYKIPVIDEDELLDMILIKSGMKPKYSKKHVKKEESIENVNVSKESSSKMLSGSKRDKTDTEIPSTSKQDTPKIVSTKKELLKNDLKKTKHTQKENEKKESKSSDDHHKKTASTKFKQTEEIVSDKIISGATNSESLMWTEKYKPKDVGEIIGQQGDKSNMKKLLMWLKNWDKNHGQPRDKNKKLVKPSPWAKNDDGSYFKCALLSGPPGVGKTTTATLVAKELGYDIVEFNASDTRSKKLLKDEVSQLISTTSLAGYFKEGSAPTKKHILLMDEVDGMAGNEDRGGIQELIYLIKSSNIPIICMCNDRQHTKIRSLANNCYDLRFSKPRLEQIRGAMMSICFKEGLKLSPDALSAIINGAGMDIRQTLNHLSMWTINSKSLDVDTAKAKAELAKKDVVIGPWDVIRKVFSKTDHQTMSLEDKSRLFFYDYSIGPLFVQENYLQVEPNCDKSVKLERFAQAADSISLGDLVDRKIRSGNNWSLLETQAIYSSVLPGHYLEGHMRGQINFPSWLGKNSRRTKFQRILSELQSHMRTSTSANKMAVNLDYIYHIRDGVVKPLYNNGLNGIETAVQVMKSYNLLREDLDNILEVSQWPRRKSPMDYVETKVKTAFTRAYNKEIKLPYAVTAAIKKNVRNAEEDDIYGQDEESDNEEKDDDDVSKDAMIKKGKGKVEKASKASASKSKEKKDNSKKGRGAKGSERGAHAKKK